MTDVKFIVTSSWAFEVVPVISATERQFKVNQGRRAGVVNASDVVGCFADEALAKSFSEKLNSSRALMHDEERACRLRHAQRVEKIKADFGQ